MQTQANSLTNQIEDKILQYIKDKELKIGDKLPTEKEMTSLFNIGRSSLREALSKLDSRDVLETRRGSGTYVKNLIPIDLDPLRLGYVKDKLELAMDFIVVRLLLEPEMAALAAKNATKEQKVEIKILCDKIEECIKSEENHLDYDIEFHSAIARYSQNKIIGNLIPLINSSVSTLIDVTNRKLLTETVYTHRLISDSIIRGDELGAKNAMIIHLDYNRQLILKKIEAQ
ncbi:MAG: FadR family transcriptional regulator [Sphaerochaetaceae bacterium]|nr:FadR family transcriptional regulator [Sphaerochaetaceae bacterium]